MQRNNPKEFVVSIDDATLEIERGINAAVAIYTAMVEGPFNPDEFMDGMYFVLARLEKCNKDLRQLVKDKQNQSSVFKSECGGHESCHDVQDIKCAMPNGRH